MKKNLLILAVLIAGCTSPKKEQATETEIPEATEKINLTLKWSTDKVMQVPEAALYDEERNVIYVANMGPNLRGEKDGNGFISKLSTDGEVLALEWVAGLHDPKGMGLANGKLYVTDIDDIVEIDPEKGQVIQRIAVENAVFLNDLTSDEEGNVYFADSNAHEVLVYKDGEVSSLFQGDTLANPNGVLAVGGKVHALSFSKGRIVTIDPVDKSIVSAEYGIQNADGIVESFGGLLASSWGGKIYFLEGEKSTLVLDTQPDSIQAADIAYIPDSNTLLVPTFFDNRLMAYEVSKK